MATDIQRPPAPPKLVQKPFNALVKFILLSPFHALMSDGLMLLNYAGRKSGKHYTLALGYMREGNIVTIFTHRSWWKNLLGNAPVTVHVKGQTLEGTAEVVHDDKARVADALLTALRKRPGVARFYNVSLDPDGQPNPESVTKMAQIVTMILIKLT